MARIARFEQLDSTNDTARDEQFTHGDVIIAERQSAGRGQRGNSWDSRSGENLTFSLVLRPEFLPADQQFLLLQAIALGISDMLGEHEIEASIKWTNDIYVGDKKIAGVLMENDICGVNLSRSIIGIGLNVNQSEFSDRLPNPTSMCIEAGTTFDRDQILRDLHRTIMTRYAALEYGEVEFLQRDYHRRLYRLNAPHMYALANDEQFVGIIRGVCSSGELNIEHPDGTIHGYFFKEVNFIL